MPFVDRLAALINTGASLHSTGVGTTSMPAGSSVQRVGEGESDVAAASEFRQLFEAHAHYVWRSLLGFGVPEADVADASQQVFVVLHRKLDRIEPGCSIRTFIYGICVRVASDFRG